MSFKESTWTAEDEQALRAEVERRFRERTPPRRVDEVLVETRVGRSEMRNWATTVLGKKIPELDVDRGFEKWYRGMALRAIAQLDDAEALKKAKKRLRSGQMRENPTKRVFTIKHSQEADRDHAKSVRQYCHTFPGDDIIRVSMAWFDLPSGFKFGILGHEVGHHLAHPDGSESAADAAFAAATGFPILRKDSVEYGNNLEWISADAEAAMFKLFSFKGL